MIDPPHVLFLLIFTSLSCDAFIQHPPIFGIQQGPTGLILPSVISLQQGQLDSASTRFLSGNNSNNNDIRGNEKSDSVSTVCDDQEVKTSKQDKSSPTTTEQIETEFELENDPQEVETSLAKVLEKARARKMVLLPYRIQAFFNNPVLIFPNPLPATFTIGDVSFVFVAIWLDSFGFALGYSIGKLTSRSVRGNSNVPVMLTELWTVGLAIGLDIVWRNVG